MTADDWDTTDELHEMMLELVRARRRADVERRRRKFRLLAVACCRDMWPWLPDPRSREAVEVAERFADGLATEAEREAAKRAAWQAYCDGVDQRRRAGARGDAAHDIGLAEHAAGWVAHKDPREAVNNAFANIQWVGGDDRPKTLWEPADLIREAFGNPFRPVAVPRSWLTANVTGLATVIYDERAFNRLPVLADALMDAGCADEQVLGHCRRRGRHVRGCWVVDLLLAKG